MVNTILSSDSYTLAASEKNLILTEASSFEDFSSSDFDDLGAIDNGDNGWLVGGSTIDQEIILIGGDRKLKMSSDPGDGSFGGPYSPKFDAVDTAGEAATGAKYTSQQVSFSFQALNIIGDNSRVEVDLAVADGTDRYNFMAIENVEGEGIRIVANAPLVTEGADSWDNDSFAAFTGNMQLIANVDASVEHTLTIRVTYVDGGDNDLVEFFLDGHSIGVSTTFENYFDTHTIAGATGNTHLENAEEHQSARLLFRANRGENGAPNDGPGGQNQGFVFDDIANTGFNNANGTGNAAKNSITGNIGANRLSGLGGDDTLNGNEGNDVLLGGGGRDKLTGGNGDDSLTGGAARDILRGGDGMDTFVFVRTNESKAGANRDVIADFVRGTDKIDLSQIDAIKGGGDDQFSWIGAQRFHHVKGELHYTKSSGGVIVEGDTDGNGVADFQIVVQKLTALSITDFNL